MPFSPADQAKRAAAARALDMVEDGMTLGLGTGSTAGWFVRLLSERMKATGISVTGVATSSATVWLAQELGVTLRKLDDVERIDLTVDGADEIDGKLNLIKGGGAALLQEKIVAAASERMVVIADDSKFVQRLGRFPLPVEIVRFGWNVTRRAVAELVAELDVDGSGVDVRMGKDGPLVTDEGQLYHRPQARPDRRRPRPRRGAERDPRRRRARPLHRHGRRRACSATPTAPRKCCCAPAPVTRTPRRSPSSCATRTPDAGRLRLRPLRHRRRVGRRPGGADRGGAGGAGRHRRGVPRRRHLRHPRLRPEEAHGLRLGLRQRLRGRRGLRLDRRARRASTGAASSPPRTRRSRGSSRAIHNRLRRAGVDSARHAGDARRRAHGCGSRTARATARGTS